MGVIVTTVALFGLLPVPASATTAPQPCPGPKPTVTTFLTSTDWYENLEFDRGRIWLSNASANRLEAYSPAGDLLATVPLTLPGAIRRGPDGWLYANFGNNGSSHANPSGVVRFHPARPEPVVYASGDVFGSANGADFDAAGNLYVSDPFSGLIKIRPGGQVDPAWRADPPFPNGVAVLGGHLYTTLVLDPRSSVVRVPLARPQSFKTLTELSPSGEGKMPDDLTVGPDHRLYVTTYGSSELFRVDLAGRACVLLSGLDKPTSARSAQSFGRHGDLYVTQASGSVLRIRLR